VYKRQGTGKELVAFNIHYTSDRKYENFVIINCGSLPSQLVESELFGYEKGAFTGADKKKLGLFEIANHGTIFLDEITELPLPAQVKLLRVIQEGEIEKIGRTEKIKVDVRIIAATNRNVEEEVKEKRFREDLYYRLNVLPIFVPDLKKRVTDIPLLIDYFLSSISIDMSKDKPEIPDETMKVFLNYEWPGNVRELKNVVEYAFAVGRGNELTLDDLPPEFRETPAHNTSTPITTKKTRHTNEADLIRETLQAVNGDLETAAEQLGMSRATFWRKRKKYGI